MGGVSLLVKLKFNEFTFVNCTARPSLCIKVLRKCRKIKSANLSVFRIAGDAFLKSLSIHQFIKYALF